MPVLITEVRMLALVSPVLGVVTSRYNPERIHPISKRKLPHRGTDFVAPIRTPIRALADGVVVAAVKRSVGDVRGNGILPDRTGSGVLVDHGNGMRTYYGHTAPAVKVGQRVSAGEVVGHSDGSGNVTGPHLHLELHVNGIAIDVEPWAGQRGLDIGITDTNQEDDVALTDAQEKQLEAAGEALGYVKWIAQTLGHGTAATPFYTLRKQLEAIQAAVKADDVSDDDVKKIVAGVLAGLPTTVVAQALTEAGIAKAVREELSRGLAS